MNKYFYFDVTLKFCSKSKLYLLIENFKVKINLLLSGFLFFFSGFSGSSSFFSLSGVFDVSSGHVKGLVDGAFLHFGVDFGGFNFWGRFDEWHDFSVVVLSNIAGLSFFDDDQFLLVFLQSLDVSLEVFGGFVSSSGVNADSDLFGFSSAQSCTFEFIISETSADSSFSVVPESWALDDGSKRTGNWSWSNGSGFSSSCLSSSDFLGWLVDPSFGEFGPGFSLSEVSVW